MVGGERAGDSELREKRIRKKRAAERRLKKLAQVLAGVDGEDKEELVLGVYDDIQEELRATLRKHKTKVCLLLLLLHYLFLNMVLNLTTSQNLLFKKKQLFNTLLGICVPKCIYHFINVSKVAV